MVEPDKIRGYIGAHDQVQKPKEDVVDPEKFKKVLKVEESTESEKREQRNKKRSEYEGETEEEADIGPQGPEQPVAETSFSEVLQDQPDKGDIFTEQPTTTARRPAPQGTDADLTYGDEKGQGLRKTIYSAPQAPPITEEVSFEEQPPVPEATQPPSVQPPPPPPTNTEAPLPSTPSAEQPMQSPSEPSSLGPPTTGETLEPGPTLEERRKAHAKESKALKKAKAETELAGLPQEKKKVETFKERKLREKFERLEKTYTEKQQAPQQKVGPQAKEKGVYSENAQYPKAEKPLPSKSEEKVREAGKKESLPQEKIQPKEKITQIKREGEAPEKFQKKQKEEQLQKSLEGSTQQPAFAERAALQTKKPTYKEQKAERVGDRKVGETVLKKTTGKESGDEGSGKEQREKKEDTQSVLDEIAASLQPEMLQMHIAPLETQEVPESKLSPQVYELFEKMVGFITIQKIDGIERTTVTIDMKGSIFNGAELILDRSKTAQDTFNIELKASPEAVALFNQNVSDLVAAFQKKDFDFRVNIKKASIHKRYAVQKSKGAMNK